MLKTSLQLFAVIIIAALLGYGITNWATPLFSDTGKKVERGDYQFITQASKQNVVMFGTSTCPFCEKLRVLLQKQGVKYKEYTLDDNQEGHAMFDQLGDTAVPVIIIDDLKITGFAKKEIIQALDSYTKGALEG